MYQLKKIDIGTVALYSFIMLFIISLIFILPFGLLGMFISSFFSPEAFPEQHGASPFRFFSGIFMFFLPFLYAIMGTVINSIIALIYNLLSIKLGGLKLNLEKLADLEESV